MGCVYVSVRGMCGVCIQMRAVCGFCLLPTDTIGMKCFRVSYFPVVRGPYP